MTRKLACVGGSRDGQMIEIPEEMFLRGYFEAISSPDTPVDEWERVNRSPYFDAEYAKETYLISACAVPMTRRRRPPMVFFARLSSISGDEAVRLLQRQFSLVDLLSQGKSGAAG